MKLKNFIEWDPLIHHTWDPLIHHTRNMRINQTTTTLTALCGFYIWNNTREIHKLETDTPATCLVCIVNP